MKMSSNSMMAPKSLEGASRRQSSQGEPLTRQHLRVEETTENLGSWGD